MGTTENTSTMTFKEKVLYHQIHPVKLSVDIGITPISLYLFWQHELLLGILVTFVPSIITSALILKFVNLENQRSSSFGRYVKKYMSHTMEGVRFAGFLIMIVGAWLHIWLPILAGLFVVLLGWIWGLIFPKTDNALCVDKW